MGWTSTHKDDSEPKGKAYLRSLFEESTPERGSWEIIDDALVERQEYYALVKRTHRDGTVRYFCLVVLVRWNKGYYNVTWKDMTEEMGPNVARCPLRILDKLDVLHPLTEIPPSVDGDGSREWATNWRQRCRTYHVLRKAGDPAASTFRG